MKNSSLLPIKNILLVVLKLPFDRAYLRMEKGRKWWFQQQHWCLLAPPKTTKKLLSQSNVSRTFPDCVDIYLFNIKLVQQYTRKEKEKKKKNEKKQQKKTHAHRNYNKTRVKTKLYIVSQS